nr:integrase, catalytic region, zinc finger, CCHC-type, peptidase aspartic, catalytic [Tanacetum cinerariifolium]
MTTLAGKAILSGAENRPPMLEKDMYDSWKSIMELYMMNRQHGRMIPESIQNGTLIWPTIKENGVNRPRKYYELTLTEAIQVDCEVKATNIILQGLPPEVYALKRGCKLYDEFDKFAYKKEETLRNFHLIFSLLLNDMNIYNVKLEIFQVNTKFLNTLPPEWSKFVTDVKLPRNLSNHRQQATINDERVTLQPVLGRKFSFATGTTRTYTPGASGSNSRKQRTVICYNCKEEGHMSKQCIKPKRKRDDAWFKDKVLVVQAQEYGQILHDKELEFFTDLGIIKDVLVEVHNPDNIANNMINQTLKDGLRKLKVKNLVNNVVTPHTIIPEMLKIDVEPIATRLLNNRIVHSDYLRLTQEQAVILKEVVQIVLWYLDFGCSKHMTGDRSQLTNFVNKLLGTVKFENDHVAKIMGYGDYQIRNVTISRVYYVEGLSHNLFSIRKFFDLNLEVTFRQHTCYIRNLEGVDLLTGSRGNNLYTLSLRDMMVSSPISRHSLVRGVPKIKFKKDYLCSACGMGKRKKKPHKPICEDTNHEKLYLLHMDLCKVLKQNSVVKRRNRTLIEAAHTMLIYAKASLFLWAEAVATVCYTQKISIIRLRYGKTPYELLHDKLPDLYFFHVFGALFYLTNDSENLGKLQPKADIGIFIGYAPTKKAFRIYNRRTRRIIETIHVNFDELIAIASKHSSLEPALHEMTPTTISSGLVSNPPSSTPFVPPTRTDWDLLFQLMFDELLNPPPSIDPPAPKVIALIAEVVAPEPAASTD